MINQITLAVVQWEREREIQEAIRRWRLLAGDGPDPDLASVTIAARLLAGDGPDPDLASVTIAARLLAGDGPDPDLASVTIAARLRRRVRPAQPARLVTP